jgi:hypothetical protein
LTKSDLQAIRSHVIRTNKQIERLQDRKERELEKATNITSNTRNDPVQGGEAHSKALNYCIKVSEIEREIAELKADRTSLENLVREAVKRLPVLSFKILYYYYAKCWKWESVANICEVSTNHAKWKLHNESLSELANYKGYHFEGSLSVKIPKELFTKRP